MTKRSFKTSGVRALALLLLTVPGQALACPKPWIYFDLGDTLIDTKTHDLKKLFYTAGAREYLSDLRSKGYPLGLIVNIPENWGSTEDAKVRALKDFIAKSWSEAAPFEWDIFDLGILVPPSDQERKPAPFLFQKAAHVAQAAGCTILYMGEAREELSAAADAGMKTYLVGQEPSFFLPESEIETYVRSSE